MLKLNVNCSLIPSSSQVKLGSSYGSLIIQYHRSWKPRQGISVKALKDETGGERSGFPSRNWDPGSEIEVPFEQRPVNEYSSLKDGVLYSWGELGPGPFFLRLGGLWFVTFTVLGVPIAAASFNPARDPLRFVLAAGTGTLFLVSLIVLRIYLGWSYVGDRLLSAVIPYEESGWYDGQMWVKPPEMATNSSGMNQNNGLNQVYNLKPCLKLKPMDHSKMPIDLAVWLMARWNEYGKEVLARDRLLGSYKVKPVIKLLKQTLVGTGALLVTAALLFTFATPVEDFLQTTFGTKQNPLDSPASKISTKLNLRKEELLKLPGEVVANDDLAAAAAEAADGRPVYCRDRFYRALAGGQYCRWEDLLK